MGLTRRSAALLVLALLAPLPAGCIAAAIPLAAGAAMTRSKAVRPHRAAAPSEASVSTAGLPSTAPVRLTSLTALPAPDTPALDGTGAAAAMQDYVLAQQADASDVSRLPSALLATPGDLTARRNTCQSDALSVFVDLDPGRGTFDPLAPGTANVALATVLGDLRAKGIAVVWTSRAGDSFTSPIRQALADSGLDPSGRDALILMRDIAERKQTRRDALAQTLCPVALVGDERADFDELYLYLRNPDAALALEAMIGNGWFLISPFKPTAPGALP